MHSQDSKKTTGIDIAYVGALARLKLTDEEIKLLGGQLTDILGYIDKLNKVPTDTVEPTTHALPLQNVYREDAAGESLSVEDVLRNAPAKVDNFFKVPKVIE